VRGGVPPWSTEETDEWKEQMMKDLRGRSFLKEVDFTREEFLYLVDLAAELRRERRAGTERPALSGRQIALIFEKTSTRTRAAFEVAAHDQGAQVTYLGPGESQLGKKESVKDTARVLGRLFDGIEFRGADHEDVETLARYAGVPVWNGLTDSWHPTQMLADVLTMRDHSRLPLEQITYAYLGDARNNTANSLLVTGALLGMDVRLGAPQALWPSVEVRRMAGDLAASSGARITVTTDVDEAVERAHYVYTDVWLSMGEPESAWEERVSELRPYQVTAQVLKATGNPDVKFMHCLPALHDRSTVLGETLYQRFGLEGIEVTDEVFESHASVVFDQAANRMPTIKAVMVATLGTSGRT
jgi:ornithine carbamoyltransferase